MNNFVSFFEGYHVLPKWFRDLNHFICNARLHLLLFWWSLFLCRKCWVPNAVCSAMKCFTDTFVGCTECWSVLRAVLDFDSAQPIYIYRPYSDLCKLYATINIVKIFYAALTQLMHFVYFGWLYGQVYCCRWIGWLCFHGTFDTKKVLLCLQKVSCSLKYEILNETVAFVLRVVNTQKDTVIINCSSIWSLWAKPVLHADDPHCTQSTRRQCPLFYVLEIIFMVTTFQETWKCPGIRLWSGKGRGICLQSGKGRGICVVGESV